MACPSSAFMPSCPIPFAATLIAASVPTTVSELHSFPVRAGPSAPAVQAARRSQTPQPASSTSAAALKKARQRQLKMADVALHPVSPLQPVVSRTPAYSAISSARRSSLPFFQTPSQLSQSFIKLYHNYPRQCRLSRENSKTAMTIRPRCADSAEDTIPAVHVC